MVAWPWKPLADALAARRLSREQQAQEASEEAQQRQEAKQKEKAKQKGEATWLARVTMALGVAGFVVSVIGVPTLWIQTNTLTEQLEVQKEDLKVSGPVLKGTALVIDDTPGSRLFTPGTRGIERTFDSGETAVGDVWVRVEVTNSGRSVGTIASASVQHRGTWLSADTLMCGVTDDGPGLRWVECELPIEVEPGGIRVFTYVLPRPPCGERPTAPEAITAAFNTNSGDRVVLPSTGVMEPYTEGCAGGGGE